MLDERADHVDLRGAQELEHLGELAILVGALREHGDEHGALGPCVVIDHLRTLGHGWSIRPQERRARCPQRARPMRSTASARRSSGAVSESRT